MGPSWDPDLFCNSHVYFSRSMVPVHPLDGAFVGPRPLLQFPCLFFSLYGTGAPSRWGLRGTPTSFAIPMFIFLALWYRCTLSMGPSWDPDLFCNSHVYFSRPMVPVHPLDGAFVGPRPLLQFPCLFFSPHGTG